jgi:hypothetical protein
MIQSTPAERYPKVSYMRPEGTMEYYTDQTRPDPTSKPIKKATRRIFGIGR